jgi:hypothetical protein
LPPTRPAASPARSRSAPVIDSGSTVGAYRTITTDPNAVRLIASSSPIITLLPASLPTGMRYSAYSQTLTATGGTAPYTNTVVAGSLPSWLSLAEGGELSGTPNEVNTYTFTVQATDALGYTGSKAYTLVIQSDPSSFFWTNTASSSWSIAGNWTNDLATATGPRTNGESNYALNFNRAGTYDTTNDLASRVPAEPAQLRRGDRDAQGQQPDVHQQRRNPAADQPDQ